MTMPAFPTWILNTTFCKVTSRRPRAPQPCRAGAPTQSARRRRAGTRPSLMALAGGHGAVRPPRGPSASRWRRSGMDAPRGWPQWQAPGASAPRAGDLDPAPAGVHPAPPLGRPRRRPAGRRTVPPPRSGVRDRTAKRARAGDRGRGRLSTGRPRRNPSRRSRCRRSRRRRVAATRRRPHRARPPPAWRRRRTARGRCRTGRGHRCWAP